MNFFPDWAKSTWQDPKEKLYSVVELNIKKSMNGDLYWMVNSSDNLRNYYRDFGESRIITSSHEVYLSNLNLFMKMIWLFY